MISYAFNLTLDFDNKMIEGSSHYECQAISDITDAYFDCWNINVLNVSLYYNGTLDEVDPKLWNIDCNTTKGLLNNF